MNAFRRRLPVISLTFALAFLRFAFGFAFAALAFALERAYRLRREISILIETVQIVAELTILPIRASLSS